MGQDFTNNGEPDNVNAADPEWLTQAEAVELLQASSITQLSRWCADGIPSHTWPRFFMFRGQKARVLYRRAELLAWQAERRRHRPNHTGGRRTKREMRSFD